MEIVRPELSGILEREHILKALILLTVLLVFIIPPLASQVWGYN